MASAQKKAEPLKKHGDALESAMADTDRHPKSRVDPIPIPDRGGHEKSHAAHLGGNRHDHTKPEGNVRQGVASGELREPPQEISRIGKQHRKQ